MSRALTDGDTQALSQSNNGPRRFPKPVGSSNAAEVLKMRLLGGRSESAVSREFSAKPAVVTMEDNDRASGSGGGILKSSGAGASVKDRVRMLEQKTNMGGI